MSAGIDYSMGTANVDHETGIHYGVIHAREVGQYWDDCAEPDYGVPTCGYCGSEYADADRGEDDYWTCSHCDNRSFEDDVYSESPLAFTYTADGYLAQQGGEDGDIFVLKAPYYTLCRFCSPCAPGAGYLLDYDDDGIRAYCFGHDWYEDGKAPYTVYRVSDDSIVNPEVGE